MTASDFRALERRVELLEMRVHGMAAASAPASTMMERGMASAPVTQTRAGFKPVSVVLSKKSIGPMLGPDRIYSQLTRYLSSKAPGVSFMMEHDYTSALTKQRPIIYVVLTTGVRYGHDLPTTLEADCMRGTTHFIALYTGALARSSAAWSVNLTPFAHSVFLNPEEGILYTPDTEDPKDPELDRIRENYRALDALARKLQ